MKNILKQNKKTYIAISTLLVLLVPSISVVACHAVAETSASSNYNDWSWFKDTYWVVPSQGIFAISHSSSNPSSFNVIRDQTVFHLTDYFNGYFTGIVAAKLSPAESVPGCQYVLGEVTPQGVVALTMYDVNTGSIINQPNGNMVMVNNKWNMVNTMTAPASSGGSVSHWAYMVLTKPGDPDWENLPYANESVPAFLANCPPGPTFSL